MRVLVTGADGFIGGALVAALRAACHAVTGVVYTRAAGPGEVRVDLTHARQLEHLPSDLEAIVHAAGIVDARTTKGLMHAVNVGGTRHVCAWAARRRIPHLIHVSSVAVYGPRVMGEARDEDTPRYGLAVGLPYMRTKALAERVVEASGVPYTILRPPAVIGPGDTVLSRSMVSALAGGGLPLVPGATPLRRVSVVPIGYLAEVVLRLLERGSLGQRLHVAAPEVALWELAEAYARAARLPMKFQHISHWRAASGHPDSGRMWLLASGRFGQSYRTERITRALGTWPTQALDEAVNEAVSGLQ